MPQPSAPVPPTPPPAPLTAEAAASQAANAAQAADAAAQAAERAAANAGAAVEGGTAAQVVVSPPGNPRAVEGLRVRRQMLREQLEGAENRRQELTQQLRDAGEGGASDPVVRAGVQARVKVADARVAQIEADIAATDRALTLASPEVLAAVEEQRPPDMSGYVDDDEAAGMMFGGVIFGILVILVAQRIRRWRRRGEQAVERPARDDARIERLSHAVDAIAVEVERIGEGQRFVTQLLAEGAAPRGTIPAPRAAAADTAEALAPSGR